MLNTEYLHFQVLVDVWLQNIKLEGKLSQGPVWVWESFSGGEGWGLGGGGRHRWLGLTEYLSNCFLLQSSARLKLSHRNYNQVYEKTEEKSGYLLKNN